MRNLSRSLAFACVLSSCVGPLPPLNRAPSRSIPPLAELHFDHSATYLPCGALGEQVLVGMDRNMTFAQIGQELNAPIPDVLMSACCLLRNRQIRSDSLAPICGL